MKFPMRRLVSICLVACAFSFSVGTMPSTADEDFSLGYWLAYWDMDSGLKEFKKVKDDASSVSYFAAYFDSSDKIFIPAEVREAKKKTKSDASTYLTIVNDKMWKNGKFTEKDLGVLRRVFADGVVMNRHVDDLIELAKDNGYDGLEIDYEQIWKDKDLRANYLHFLEILNRRAQSQNLKLRVVLEPSVDFSAGFPDGPQYVVMMYNLFGTHSGPGPKANEKFILSVLQRMMYLPGEKAVAFSTGGCSWKDGSRGIFIDEAQAVKTAKGHSVVPKRDGDSAALYYDYTDGGKRVTVWYADKDTLNAWITVAKNYGINHVSLWRLGSNTDIHGVKVP